MKVLTQCINGFSPAYFTYPWRLKPPVRFSFEKPEKKHKFEREVDIILQNRKPMGIREEILYDAKWQGIQEERKRLTKKFEQQQRKVEQQQQLQLEQKLKTTILNLQQEGFSTDKIAMIMSISVEKVEDLIKPS